MENSIVTPQKLKTELPYDREVPNLGAYPKEIKNNTNLKRYMQHLLIQIHGIYCTET